MFCTNRWRGHRQVFNRNCAPGWNKTGLKPVSLSVSFFNEFCKKMGMVFLYTCHSSGFAHQSPFRFHRACSNPNFQRTVQEERMSMFYKHSVLSDCKYLYPAFKRIEL